jgi:hypothetical protein
MRHKSETLDKFKVYKAQVENHTGKRILALRTDRGGEYINAAFDKYRQDNGIQHQTTTPYTPQQNGVSERLNRTLFNMGRSMLKEAGLPNALWADAIMAASYIRNRVPSEALGGKIPYKLYTGENPDLSYFKVFGCLAYPHKFNTTKLEDRATVAIMVGYDSIGQSIRGYRFWDPRKKRYYLSRSVDWNEQKLYKDRFTTDLSEPPLEILRDEVEVVISPEDVPSIIESEEEIDLDDTQPTQPVPEAIEDDTDDYFAPLYPERVKQKKKVGFDLKQNQSYTAIESKGPKIPKSFHDVMNSLESQEWLDAMTTEYNALMENKTWTLEELPPYANCIKGKWLWDLKRDGSGNITKYKARWVAKGYSQIEGLDYEETFAPASHLASLRLILAVATIRDWEIHQVDIKTAFLNGTIDTEIYVEQPHNFINSEYPSKVCKLQKSLYGLKQAPRLWNKKLQTWLLDYGFTQLKSDPSIYILNDTLGTIIIGVHVDDMIITSNSTTLLNIFESDLEKRFKLTKELNPTWFLGMTIRRNRKEKTLYLGMKQHIIDMLEEFRMSDCNSSPNPIPSGHNLSHGPWQQANTILYQKAIGKLLYLARATRPDISAIVGILGQYVKEPLTNHWDAVIHVLKYLKGTTDMELCLSGKSLDVIAYSDADWAGDTMDRKSRSGTVIYLGNSAIVWSSLKQEVVARSTTEAEYIALSMTVTEVLWIRSILKELDILAPYQSIPIFEDNRGCKFLAHNPHPTPKTKHIDIRHHFIKDHLQKGDITIEDCSTEFMVADIFTKGLSTVKLHWCCNQLMLLKSNLGDSSGKSSGQHKESKGQEGDC